VSSISVPRTLVSQKEHSGSKKKVTKAPTNLYELTFSCLGPTSYVNPLLNVKVISS
jgi:hypothetical protein